MYLLTFFFILLAERKQLYVLIFFLNTPESHLDTRKHDDCFKSLAWTSVCAARRAHLSHSGLSYGSGELQAEGLLSTQEGKVAFSTFVGIVAPVSTLWTENDSNVTNAWGTFNPYNVFSITLKTEHIVVNLVNCEQLWLKGQKEKPNNKNITQKVI